MKKIIVLLLILLASYVLPSPSWAVGEGCTNTDTCEGYGSGLICIDGRCQLANNPTKSPIDNVFGKITPPPQIGNIGFGAAGISNLLNKIIQLIYMGASVVFLFMIIFSAFQWITSGGDKEKVGQARARLTHAIIGITLLALAFVIARIIGGITGFNFFSGQNNVGVTPTPTTFSDCSTVPDNQRVSCCLSYPKANGCPTP